MYVFTYMQCSVTDVDIQIADEKMKNLLISGCDVFVNIVLQVPENQD